MMRYSYFKGESYRRWDALEALFNACSSMVSEIAGNINNVAESKRLSTVLTIEAKKDIDIKPEDFEPKREELRKNMLGVFDERLEREKGKINDPGTLAFVILDHSGFNQFVDFDVKKKAEKALARLLANNNIPAAKHFITTLALNL